MKFIQILFAVFIVYNLGFTDLKNRDIDILLSAKTLIFAYINYIKCLLSFINDVLLFLIVSCRYMTPRQVDII